MQRLARAHVVPETLLAALNGLLGDAIATAGMARLERHVALERRADWLVMATRLLLLRSRLMFPASPGAEAEALQDAGHQARRLDQMMVVRAAAAWFDRRPQLGRDVFVRPQDRNARVASYMRSWRRA